ncbi:hypothetical protein [Actinoplanes sp. L3-i22]|uniref:hypothetical protein n=1 Tax=Actinoplanes sp. L3-i22 TaxID=2836373 RepID=UPI002104112D|nr:hypothetical protein [Actinoplanes sp. L3-i22]
MDLFGPADDGPPPKPPGNRLTRLEVLVTVKAAPNPSEKYGETVCVAGLSTDLMNPGWVRLYPINVRALDDDESFRKYDLISVDATPAAQDQRRESWRPRMTSMIKVRHLKPWKPRRAWVDPYVVDSMCELNRAAIENANAKSLGLVRPREVVGIRIKQHPGWTPEEQRKIDGYVNQLDLFSEEERIPLQAPRFKVAYRYFCQDTKCRGHEQGLLDWEFVALQRRLRHLPDSELAGELESKFLTMMCDASRDVAFYVGNQAKRAHVFSVLGVYYPGR